MPENGTQRHEPSETIWSSCVAGTKEGNVKIVVGYDGSKASDRALELAINRAKAFKATVYPVLSLHGEWEDEEAQIAKSQAVLMNAQERVEGQDVGCETHLLIRGLEPGEDIVQFAEEHGADEIIMGVKRRTKVDKLIFGSNARFVILNAPCPVTTVR